MTIKYQNKPTLGEINQFCSTVEKFLSAHNLIISIEFYDSPIRIVSFVNNEQIGITHCWISKCIINSQATSDPLEVKLFNQGIELDEHKVWAEAWYIQNQIYNKLKLTPRISDRDDPYWKLWDHLH